MTVEGARALIRQARERLPEPLPKTLLPQALKHSWSATMSVQPLSPWVLTPGGPLLLLILAGFESKPWGVSHLMS